MLALILYQGSLSLFAGFVVRGEASTNNMRAPSGAQEGTHLSGTAITDKHKLEGGHVACCGSFGHDCGFVVVAGLIAVWCAKAVEGLG